jgi:hypothetical protein
VQPARGGRREDDPGRGGQPDRQPGLSGHLPDLGDDPVSDDFIAGPDPLSVNATPEGLKFNGSRGLPCSSLNEDDAPLDRADEIYAGVRLVKGYLNGQYGPTLRSDETNRIYGRF